ncbi:YveK family protein [Paenibacillus baekrokdamisoli]|nr:Wzz/FepE/Etk N-terminal domain-containing protein [Paenibacillus baekrokdamisoli]
MSALLGLLLKRFWIVIISLAVFVGPILYYSSSKPAEYTADASVYILRQTTSTSTNLYQELLAAISLIKDYKVLLPSDAVTYPVQEQLAAQYKWAQTLTPQDIAKKVEITNKNDSHIVTVSVKDQDPQKAAIIANQIIAVFKEFSKKITVDDSVIDIKAATPPTKATSFQKLYLAAAGLVGLLVGLVVALFPAFTSSNNDSRRRKKSF